MMTTRRRWKPALPLASLLWVAGCATQQAMPEQKQAAVECGVGGVAIGYLACKLAGGSDAACLAVGAGVGAVGAVACYSYADNLKKRQQELAGRENDLNARIRYVKGLNEDGEKLNADLRQRVTAARQRVDDLTQQGARASAQLAKERARIDDELKVARQDVALQKQALDEIKVYQRKRSTPSKELDAEIARQERLLADTQRQVDDLASVRQRV